MIKKHKDGGGWGWLLVSWSPKPQNQPLLIRSVDNQQGEGPVTDKSTHLKLIQSRWAFYMLKEVGRKERKS